MISCSNCNSKYLVNSADLKPDGRLVQCANCSHKWFQVAGKENAEHLLENNNFNRDVKEEELLTENKTEINNSNLPSTYVREQNVSLLNSFLIIVFIFFLLFIFLFLKNIDKNNLILFKFYIYEFYFNLNLIINDVSNIIYHIINRFKAN